MAVISIDQMTLEEKLLAMEALWGDLCRREADLPMLQWQKDLLDERERLVRDGKARFTEWETAKRRITGQTS
jgi:hypothetical protein